MHIPGVGAGVHPSEDKLCMVEWACDAARRVDGAVHVRDRGGAIETVYLYKDGAQQKI
ncbi:MAG TPA: hypothetical protein VFY92_04595 [Hyphomicrobiaceae bacterium]|nr:hypothetical protein [Hyphomicrobiaceae bacterium]